VTGRGADGTPALAIPGRRRATPARRSGRWPGGPGDGPGGPPGTVPGCLRPAGLL